jgi:hypothetical protein
MNLIYAILMSVLLVICIVSTGITLFLAFKEEFGLLSMLAMSGSSLFMMALIHQMKEVYGKNVKG